MAYSTFLGYDKGEDGKLKINKEQAETVKLIYNLFLSGLSFYKIKQELERRKLKSPTGQYRWHQSTVKSILLNEKYAGDALLQKTYTVDFLTKKTKKNEGELQQYVVTNDHETIISKSMFDAVKQVIKERGESINKYVNHSPITKKLFCGECGEHMGRKTWHSNDNYRSIQYRCKNRYEGTKTCKNRNVREEVVMEEFVKALNEHIKDKKEFIKAREEQLKNVGNIDDIKAEITAFENKKIETIEAINEIDNVYAKTGKDSNKRFELNGDLVTINNKITELNEKVATIEYKKIAIKNEIDILNGNAPAEGERIPVSSHAVIKY